VRVELTPGQAKLLRERYAPLHAAEAAFTATLDAILADHLPCEVEHLEIAEGAASYIVLKDQPDE